MHLILTFITTVLWFFLSVMLLTFICRRKRVRVFKFGPDYLDPQILERASKAPVVQLDLWMAGEAWCKQQIYRAVTEGKADIVLVEGAMGLYDGNDCSADLAAKFRMPVACRYKINDCITILFQSSHHL